MAVKKYYTINFPFTAESQENFYLDMASDPYISVKQDLTHLLFTPRGTKLRDPSFGTGLLSQIFEPMDTMTFGDIKMEFQTIVNRYFSNVTITKLDVIPDEENRSVRINIFYTIDMGNFTVNDQINYEL
jgi:phage baseplate assembly protein W